jgi:hypothetical protein
LLLRARPDEGIGQQLARDRLTGIQASNTAVRRAARKRHDRSPDFLLYLVPWQFAVLGYCGGPGAFFVADEQPSGFIFVRRGGAGNLQFCPCQLQASVAAMGTGEGFWLGLPLFIGSKRIVRAE